MEGAEASEGACFSRDNRRRRVPVTASMLYAYAQMRGKSSLNFDPLHEALYCETERNSHSRIWLPMMTDYRMMEELPRGTVLHWDSDTPVYQSPQQEQAPPAEDHKHVRLRGPRQNIPSFEDYTRQNPPRFRPNHYKGDQAYANYGYVLINGTWVDPDSEGACFDAFNKNPRSVPAELPGSRSFRPRIMDEDQENEFYRQYVADVTDEIDGEGDPRALRISSQEFARWATGVVRGDEYEQKEVGPQELVSRREQKAAASGVKVLKSKPQPQFDFETGSTLSHAYENEQTPSPLLTAAGVDIVQRPTEFCRSYPQAAIDMEWAAFGPFDRDNPLQHCPAQPVTSVPDVFSSENAWKALRSPASSLGNVDPHNTTMELLTRLQEQQHEGVGKMVELLAEIEKAVGDRDKLRREVFFLQSRRQNDLDNHPSGQESPGRGQYQRYFEERIKRHRLLIGRTCLANERLNTEFQLMLEEIKELLPEREKLLKYFGVTSADQIHDLIPQR